MIAGAIGVIGVLLGVFAERMFQRIGRVRVEIARILIFTDKEASYLVVTRLPVPEHICVRARENERLRELENGPGAAHVLSPVTFRVTVELFDEKDRKTALRDIAVVFKGAEVKVRKVVGIVGEDVQTYTINLPSREWVVVNLRGGMSLDELEKLTKCNEAYFEGEYPDGPKKRWKIPTGD